MWLLTDSILMKSRMALSNFLRDEEGDVNIVSMVVLIGIAVLLAVIFRSNIQSLLSSMFDTISNNANSAIN